MKVLDRYMQTYQKILTGTTQEDFKTLNLKHPDCGDFETYWKWYLYFLQELQTMDWSIEFANKYDGSPWRFISGKAEEVRSDILQTMGRSVREDSDMNNSKAKEEC